MVTDSGEGGGLVDVSAASTVLAVMHAVSGGAGGWKTVRRTSKTPCSSFPVEEGRIEARTPRWKRLGCSERRDDSLPQRVGGDWMTVTAGIANTRFQVACMCFFWSAYFVSSAHVNFQMTHFFNGRLYTQTVAARTAPFLVSFEHWRVVEVACVLGAALRRRQRRLRTVLT